MKVIRFLLTSVFLLFIASAGAQSLPDSTIRKIDSIFGKWNNRSSPGCTVGIVRNDSILFSKGYGMANLEYGIPNQPQTIFHMASVSKQFTAYAIILLARQGKLSLDDDIRKYLPWFHDMKQKITIRHLLNHTSGIRDQWQLLAIAGTRLDDVITQDHIVKVLGEQRALNSKPGELYNYSNSGFTMLAEIVRAASGQTLRQFTDSAIFKPLGMTKTHFHDNYREIEPARSYSYERLDSVRFENAVLSYSNAGATSLFTNIDDLSKWAANFYSTKVGDTHTLGMLTEKGHLNNGQEITYAAGIAVGAHNGWREFSHSGGDAGFRTYLTVFPDLKMGFMVFSNLGDVNVGDLTYAVAELFVRDTASSKITSPKPIRDTTAAILADTTTIAKFLGDYIGNEGLPFHFELKNRILYYQIYNERNFLIREKGDTFTIGVAPEIKFVLNPNSKDASIDLFTPSQRYHLMHYRKNESPSTSLLRQYVGTYYCPELDTKYGIELKHGKLVLTNKKYNDASLTLIGTEHLTSDNWWLSHLLIRRGARKEIVGFEVNSGRVMHLQFDKIK